MCGRLREKEVKVFSGDEEGVLQRVEKKEGVIGLFRGKELRCSRTCQGPGSFGISGELITASGTIVGPIVGYSTLH